MQRLIDQICTLSPENHTQGHWTLCPSPQEVARTWTIKWDADEVHPDIVFCLRVTIDYGWALALTGSEEFRRVGFFKRHTKDKQTNLVFRKAADFFFAGYRMRDIVIV